MTQPKLTVILASAVLLISLISIGWRFWPAGAQVNTSPLVGLGQVLAEETIKAVTGKGRVVAVINGPFQIPGSPLQDELEAFRSQLKKNSSVSLVATEALPVDLGEMVIGNNCSSAQLRDILANHGDADAIVFFIGLPEWGKLLARGVPLPGTTKFIVAMEAVPTKREYGGYFANGFLSVLIGRRYGPVQSAKPKTPREWFDSIYQIVKPADVDTLPD